MSLAPNEYRCTHCHKLLFKGILVEGDIEIKCKACHEFNTIAHSNMNDLLCMIAHCPHRVHMTPPVSSVES